MGVPQIIVTDHDLLLKPVKQGDPHTEVVPLRLATGIGLSTAFLLKNGSINWFIQFHQPNLQSVLLRVRDFNHFNGCKLHELHL